ncbi:MAG TPA: esterase-like activity of phytase family protein [Chthoniobacteraceae bacterium]|nr:esterase-like activity of phytase family protein [Chthoniobacteraceae bacterium]
MWIANEQALEHESHTANSNEGSLIRLQRFDDGSLAPAGQWAYQTDPFHGAPDLVALPNGRLLVLERAFSFGSSGTHHNRIYLVDFSNATDTSGIADLDDGGFVLTSKTLLWDQDMGTTSTHNFEGIALGPSLGSDSYSLLLIADNNTGSTQHLYALQLHNVPEPTTLTSLAMGGLLLTRRRR